MEAQTDILNIFVFRLISSPANDEAIQSLIKIFEQVIVLRRCLPNFDIPYEDITEIIYNYPEDINLDDLDLMMEGLETQFVELFPKYRNGTKHKSHRCLSKFRTHIYLAAVQKNFIKKITQDAQQMASTARNISNLANEAAVKANKSSERAELLAVKAEDLANDADAQAKSTIANYISILGIFASIIFTLFGGVNLIGSTVKLLETGSRWPYLTFIISLLMICLLTLLNMMVKWINSMSNLKRVLEKEEVKNNGKLPFKFLNPCTWDFYTKAVSCFLFVLLISMCGMYHVKKEEFKSHTKEITSQMESSKSEAKSNKNNTQSNKPSMTVVEKITVANQLPNSKEDKDD